MGTKAVLTTFADKTPKFHLALLPIMHEKNLFIMLLSLMKMYKNTPISITSLGII